MTLKKNITTLSRQLFGYDFFSDFLMLMSRWCEFKPSSAYACLLIGISSICCWPCHVQCLWNFLSGCHPCFGDGGSFKNLATVLDMLRHHLCTVSQLLWPAHHLPPVSSSHLSTTVIVLVLTFGNLSSVAQLPKYRTFDQNFNFILRRDHQKNFLWSSCLWIGRRKQLILGYVPKNDEKKNLVRKALIFSSLPWHFVKPLKIFLALTTSLIRASSSVCQDISMKHYQTHG